MNAISSIQPAVAPVKSPRFQRGYNLIEVMIGLSIFSFMAIGLISLSFMARASSEEAVYHNTSLTLAQAYIEQLRSSDYSTIAAAAADSAGTVPLNLISSDGSVVTDESNGTLTNSEWANETIMLDETAAGEPKQPMTFRFRPVLNDLTAISGNTAEGVEVILFYETTYNFGVTRTHRGSLRTVRSSIPTY